MNDSIVFFIFQLPKIYLTQVYSGNGYLQHFINPKFDKN